MSFQTSETQLKPTYARYGVLGFCLTLAAIAYLDRVCISTAAPAICFDLKINKQEMGYVFSAFTLAYALMEIPGGWLADKFGPRLMLTRVVIWWSMFTALTGLATGLFSLLAIRALFGVGEAGCWPGISRAYTKWLPVREHGRAFGVTIMTGVVGGALTLPLVVYLLGVISWRHAFPIFGAVGVVWALCWLWWFRDDPAQHSGVNTAELKAICSGPKLEAEARPKVPWLTLIRSRNMFGLCFMYFGAIYGWYFFLTWMPTYLLEARGFNLKTAGWLSAAPLAGIGVGVLIGGWFSDWLSKRIGTRLGRRIPGLISLPLASVAVVAAVATPSSYMAACFLTAAAALSAVGVAGGWAVCLEIGGSHTGVVTGAMNMFGNGGGALSPLVVGCCVQRFGSYDLPLLTLAFFDLLSAVCWLAIDATQPLEPSKPRLARDCTVEEGLIG